MQRKKVSVVICIVLLSLATAALAVWSLFLSSKLGKTEALYAEQCHTNEKLAAMIEGGTKPSANAENIDHGVETGIPDEIYDKIFGITLFDDSPVTRGDLVYLTVPYYNFNGEDAIGHIIVNEKISEEVLDIFSELYEAKYPIEKMDIAEEYDSMQSALLNSTELASKGSNNTCALYYSSENGEFTPHASGLAIDLNPKINPSRDIYGAPVPKNAGRYANNENLTDTEKYAKITEDSDIYRIFTEHGWTWDSSNPCCFVKE